MAFLFVIGISQIWADEPDLPKYPAEITQAKLASTTSLTKVKDIPKLGEIMKKGEAARTALAYGNYAADIKNEVLKKYKDEAAVIKNVEKLVKEWDKQRKVLLKELKAIKEKVESILKNIDKKNIDGENWLKVVKGVASGYAKKIEAIDKGAIETYWKKQMVERWEILTGQRFIKIATNYMNQIKQAAPSVKNLADWSSKEMQSELIRGVGTVTPHLKEQLGTPLVDKWRIYSSDGWQPKTNEEVATKLGELLKLVSDTEAKL